MEKKTYFKSNWANGQASIMISPDALEDDCIGDLLKVVQQQYSFEKTKSVVWFDGKYVDITLKGEKLMIIHDIWDFSVAFETEALRDEVLEYLQSVPQ